MLLALLNVLLVSAKTINGCCMFSFTHPIELYLFIVRKNSVFLSKTLEVGYRPHCPGVYACFQSGP